MFEEEYVDVWANQYGYDMDVIEIALQKTSGKSNLSFKYIHKILSDWHKENLKTKDDVLNYIASKPSTAKAEAAVSKVPQSNNFEQRQYSDEFYEKIMKSTFK